MVDPVEDLQISPFMMRMGNNSHLRCWKLIIFMCLVESCPYEEGYPVIWLSTDIADYDCIKPSSGYKMFYDHFFAKASACVEVYKKLTSSGGNPSLTLDELLAAVARALTGQKCFSSVASIKNFILSQGGFIYTVLPFG